MERFGWVEFDGHSNPDNSSSILNQSDGISNVRKHLLVAACYVARTKRENQCREKVHCDSEVNDWMST
jgi:hypothetical protein